MQFFVLPAMQALTGHEKSTVESDTTADHSCYDTRKKLELHAVHGYAMLNSQ